MLERFLQFFLVQRMFVLLLIAALAVGGWQAFKNLPIDAFPEVSPTQVKMIFKAPGMTPTEVEQRVLAPLEMELLGLPNQEVLRSLAKYSIADITLDFREGTDIYWARQQVAERLNSIDLPAGVTGGMAPMSTPLSEVFMFTIESDSLNNMEKRDLLDWVIRPALRSVKGVADVNALGGLARTFVVEPDFEQMASLGITMDELVSTLEKNNQNDGAGRLNMAEEVLLVRSIGALETIQDIQQLVVKVHNDITVTLGQIARVKIQEIYRNGAVTQNGNSEAVQGIIVALKGANARQLIMDVETRIDDLSVALPKGTEISVFYNRSDLINTAIGSVSKALLEAVALVLIVLLLFLGNIRAALAVAVILPLAALLTFILMRWFDLSANLMSLGGLAIAIGILVDAAVVVVENIVAQQERALNQPRMTRLHVIFRALKEVAIPVISGILIIIVVFLPLLTLEGIEGKLFTPVAVTIIMALASSLLLSLTVIPTLSSFILGTPKHEEPWLIRQISKVYQPLLIWSLQHAKIVIGLALAAFVIAGVLFTQVGKTFMPQMDEGDLILQIEKTPSISLETSILLDQRIQTVLMREIPEIKRIVARLGSDELGLDPMSLNDTDSFLVLHPKDQWRMDSKEALVDEIRSTLEKFFPGIGYAFTQPIQMRTEEMLSGARGDVVINIFGDNPLELSEVAQAVAKMAEDIEGSRDVFTATNDGLRYLQVEIKRDQAARLGVSIQDVQQLLRVQINGLEVGTLYQGIRQIPLMIRGSLETKSSIDAMLDQPVSLQTSKGLKTVYLKQLVSIAEVTGPVMVQREQSKRFAVVSVNVEGRDLVGFVEEAKELAKHLNLPAGYYFEWGGEFENQQRAAERLSVVIPVALGLIFIILFSTFGSVKQALMVMGNVPFALIGGVFALWATNEYLSVPASVGFIALLGIAVLNGVVLISYFNQLRSQGLEIKEVVLKGAMRRLRPVLMTASIAALGLIPLVFATGPGSEVQRPLAIVVIGGLITSTILTLLLMPMVYQKFMSKSQN
ncbi:CusA/CzcA family heavy metal efflux RND transporter [Thiomicrorhabdus indica]|uniref:efflux RND transporter permease subunit n=1 Tax=Thiomicrorhabdus indica TaxID=2267253 RepID=UPI002AA75907|nr:CusA/CzcA family heavy metal efflux RND transporter [Thiomicrorhabdus indica]